MKVAFLGRHFPKNSLSIGINISPLLTTKEHGANVEKICISAHGPFTHIDTPYHFCDHGRKITDFDVEDFCGPGVLFDARGWDLKKKLVTLEMFKEAGGANLLSLGSQRVILLVWTGWYEGKVIDSDFTKDHPVIEEKLAQALTGLPIKMVCLDTPSPDPSNGPYDVHQILLQYGIFIGESFGGLEAIKDIEEDFSIVAYPLPLPTGGAPVVPFAIR